MGRKSYGSSVGLIKDKGIYLSRRIDTLLFSKKWQLINGLMQAGENGRTTAVRIINEQTGLVIPDSRLYYMSSYDVEAANELYFIYLVCLQDNEVPENKESAYRSDWKFFKMEAAIVLDLIPGLRRFLFKLNRALLRVETEQRINQKKQQYDYEDVI